MKNLYDPITLGGIATQNRIVRSATFEFSLHAKGDYNPEYAQIYEALAKGGVGVIITGMVAVDANSPINPHMIRAYDDKFVPGLRQIVKQVHTNGSRLVVQISHCGVHAAHIEDGGPRLGASAMQTASGVTVQAMTAEDISEVVAHFADTSARCKEAGADGVQLHAAHGYLLSQFLSPYYNRRDDGYGGDIAGRSRIVLEVYDAVRNRVGADYSVWIKINNSDRRNRLSPFAVMHWLMLVIRSLWKNLPTWAQPKRLKARACPCCQCRLITMAFARNPCRQQK